jgi:hypothetical protein
MELSIVISMKIADKKLAEEILASMFIENLVNSGAEVTASLSEKLTVTLGGPN